MPNVIRRLFCAAALASFLLMALPAQSQNAWRSQSVGLLPPQGLFVAKYRVRPDHPTLLEVIYYHDTQVEANDHAPRSVLLSTDGPPIDFPGSYSLQPRGRSEIEEPLEIKITSNSETGLAVVIHRAGREVARGLAIVDPDDPHALLVSGWTGTTKPYGIAKYRIRDEHTITGVYLSRMSPDHLGIDTATGDTTDGFPGKYSLTTLEVNGRTWGPHDWRLSQRGELFDLVWREGGEVICRGFGILDPEDPQGLIVNYVPVDG